jgi:hypothetical protein
MVPAPATAARALKVPSAAGDFGAIDWEAEMAEQSTNRMIAAAHRLDRVCRFMILFRDNIS